MSNLWDQFDKAIDTKALANEVKNSTSSDFPEIPHGEYEVAITKMELGASKTSHKPMVTVWFKIVSGEYKGNLIFWNQVVENRFQIHTMNEFLRSLDSGIDVDFVTYNQYGNMIMDIHEAITDKLEYALDYGENNRGYNTYKIKEVFEVEE